MILLVFRFLFSLALLCIYAIIWSDDAHTSSMCVSFRYRFLFRCWFLTLSMNLYTLEQATFHISSYVVLCGTYRDRCTPFVCSTMIWYDHFAYDAFYAQAHSLIINLLSLCAIVVHLAKSTFDDPKIQFSPNKFVFSACRYLRWKIQSPPVRILFLGGAIMPQLFIRN